MTVLAAKSQMAFAQSAPTDQERARFRRNVTRLALGGGVFLLLMFIIGAPRTPWGATPINRPCVPDAALAATFSAKSRVYESRLATLDDNLKLQGLIAVVAIAVMASRKKSLEVPLFRIGVPTTMLYLLLPSLALFLWLQFGYLLSSLIELRISLFELADAIEPRGLKITSFESRAYGLRTALNDGGFLDAWFRAYLPNFIDGRHYSWLNTLGNWLAITIVYGGLLGAAHGAMLYTLFLGQFRCSTPAFARVHRGALIGVSIMLFMTHFQFYLAESNQSWQHFGIALGLVGTVRLVDYVLRAVDQEPDSPDS